MLHRSEHLSHVGDREEVRGAKVGDLADCAAQSVNAPTPLAEAEELWKLGICRHGGAACPDTTWPGKPAAGSEGDIDESSACKGASSNSSPWYNLMYRV